MSSTLKASFDTVLASVTDACRSCYGLRLISLAVFGSVARGAMRPDSDIDLLLVVDPLPAGRLKRMEEFEKVETALVEELERCKREGIHTSLSPVFKTVEELRRGSLLFLDMTLEARILYDPHAVLGDYLKALAARLQVLGSRRVRRAGGYYWRLTPTFKPGDVIEL
jgi:predicted nucleotidyltransferase